MLADRHVTLVTGGAGFLGSHLCDRLIGDGDRVICLDNFFTGRRENIAHLLSHPRFEYIRADVAEPRIFEVDRVYHLACPASPKAYQKNPVRTIRTCVLGTLNMLELCREVGARLLVTSTSEVYGDPQVHPQSESYWGHVNPTGPRACYDEGKRCAESLCVSFAQTYGVEVRIARIFNTYGPRMHSADGRVVSNFIRQAIADDPLTIYGTGDQTRSFCYVDDLIEGLVRLMVSNPNACPVNLGNPEEYTMKALADQIIALVGSKSSIVFEDLPKDDPMRRRPDISRAQKILDWSPRTPVTEGLGKTIAYQRQLAGGS